MKVSVANEVRANLIAQLLEQFSVNEDCGMVNSNTFNFPIVKDDEEGWVEIVVKVPKYTDDEGYALREEYTMKCEEKRVKAEEQAKKKAEKIKKDEEKRKAKAEAKKGE